MIGNLDFQTKISRQWKKGLSNSFWVNQSCIFKGELQKTVRTCHKNSDTESDRVLKNVNFFQ